MSRSNLAISRLTTGFVEPYLSYVLPVGTAGAGALRRSSAPPPSGTVSCSSVGGWSAGALRR